MSENMPVFEEVFNNLNDHMKLEISRSSLDRKMTFMLREKKIDSKQRVSCITVQLEDLKYIELEWREIIRDLLRNLHE